MKINSGFQCYMYICTFVYVSLCVYFCLSLYMSVCLYVCVCNCVCVDMHIEHERKTTFTVLSTLSNTAVLSEKKSLPILTRKNKDFNEKIIHSNVTVEQCGRCICP